MVSIVNSFDIVNDPKMRFLGEVISPVKVVNFFQQYFPHLLQQSELREIKVIRYKPKKRCLIEYSFDGEVCFSLIGKVRAKGTDFNSYHLQQYLWNHGFDDCSFDKISVPEAIGVIDEWQMWLQKKVAGKMATELIFPGQNPELIKKIAHVSHKLHQVGYLAYRVHKIEDELLILQEKLPLVLGYYPEWKKRLDEILLRCDRLTNLISETDLSGIHRDFYSDQIIINNDHFYLLDLDLYCQGNPGLDIGNFIGHITEFSIRKWGDFTAQQHLENALREEFIKLAGEKYRQSVTVYTILTLVRHIYLSTQFPERRFTTVTLLNLCEVLLKNLT